MGNELVLKLRVDGGQQSAAEIDRAAASVGRLGQAANSAGNAVGGSVPKLRGMATEATSLSSSLAGAARSLAGIGLAAGGAALGVAAIGAVARPILDAQVAAQKLQATLTYIAGGASGAGKEFEYLARTSSRLGLDFSSASTAYAKFSAATKESGISADATRQTFEGVAKAASHMGLSAEETNGALLALSQMASKGTVSAEELRGQLGERLPGAFSLAAKAMGVTEQALGKMLEKGEVAASDFLPRFARVLNESFAQPVDNVVSEINRLSSAFDLFKRALLEGNAGGLFAPLTNGLNESAAAMRKLGSDASLTQRLLVAVGAALAGAAGKGSFDIAGRQKRLMEQELPDVKRQIAELEGKRDASVFNRLNLIDGNKLTELQARAKALRSELDSLAVQQGKLSGFQDPNLKGQYEAQQKAARERVQGYLGDTANESKAVKLAAQVEAENKAFQKATVGLTEVSKEYQEALVSHQRRVAEIESKGVAKGGGGGRAPRGDGDRLRREMEREIEQQARQELADLKKEADHQKAQERAKTVMDRTVGNLEDTYRRQAAIYSEKDMTEPQRALAEALRKVEEAADAARESLAQKASTLEVDDVQALEAYRQAMISVNDQEERQVEVVKAHQAEQERLNSLWETGATRAMTKYKDTSKSVADQTEAVFTRAFHGMEDALMTFITTGKANFADLAKSIIADLARIEIKAMLSNLMKPGNGGGGSGDGKGLLSGIFSSVKGFFGFAHGGVFAAGVPPQAFAAGGAFTNRIVNQPTLFRFASGASMSSGLMGEAGPEAIMPLARDGSGRLGVRTAGGAGANVTVNITGIGGTPDALRRASGEVARRVAEAVNGARRYG